MKKELFGSVIVISILVLTSSCKGKLFRNPTEAMEETIKMGETFYVERTKNFKRDDIVVFDFLGEDPTRINPETDRPEMSWQKWFKRLIAISGDSIQIKNADVILNGISLDDPPLSISDYEVLSTVTIDDFPERNLEMMRAEKKGDTFYYCVQLKKDEAENYRQRKPAVVSVKKLITPYSSMDTFIIKYCTGCEWTLDNFGPLKIPAPGDTIIVDEINYRLYRNIPGIQMGKNVIKEKLYFVMGDNRHQSMDSRYIGYISHSKMYGIVK